MKVAYYPGCSYETSGKDYETSAKFVCNKLGIDLVEIPDWSCCGSTAAHSTDHLLAVSLAARNLALVEKMGFDTVTATCSACYQRLALTQAELAQDKKLLEQVNEITGYDYKATVKVNSILEIIAGLDEESIKAKVTKSMKDFRIATYYGCLLVRPSKVKIDDPENPTIMDRLMQATGAQVVDWSHKTECCGASLSVTNNDIVIAMVSRIIKAAKAANANCIVTPCAFCHMNLDYYQSFAAHTKGALKEMPVFYFTQILGLAMGFSKKDMGVEYNITDTSELVKKVV